MALTIACSNPTLTLDFVRNAEFVILMKAQITRKKINLPKLFFVCISCQISMFIDPHLNEGRGWRRETGLSPPVKYFTDPSKAVLLL